MRELARDREFVAYFAARQTAGLAYSVETVAIGWQIYTLRHNPFDIGLVGLVLFVPQLLLAIPAGAMADRFDRRIVCVACTVGEMLAELVFLGLVLEHVHSVAANLAAVALVGIAHSLGTPAERALLAGIVRSEKFAPAQAVTTSAMQVITIAGPAVGGVLIALSVPAAFTGAAALYGLASIAFGFLTPRPGDVERPKLGSWIDGVRFIAGHRVVLGAISLDLFAVLFGGATALLPVYATTILRIGPIGFGALRSAPAVGAAAVALYLARRPIMRRAGPLLLWCVTGFGIATIVFGRRRIRRRQRRDSLDARPARNAKCDARPRQRRRKRLHRRIQSVGSVRIGDAGGHRRCGLVGYARRHGNTRHHRALVRAISDSTTLRYDAVDK